MGMISEWEEGENIHIIVFADYKRTDFKKNIIQHEYLNIVLLWPPRKYQSPAAPMHQTLRVSQRSKPVQQASQYSSE